MKRSAIIRIIVFALIILMLGWLLAAGIARENRVPAASNTSDSTTPTDKTSAGAEGRETSASGTDSGEAGSDHPAADAASYRACFCLLAEDRTGNCLCATAYRGAVSR